MLVIFIFIAIALVMALGIVYITGKGLNLLYIDKEPLSEEVKKEYIARTNPVHMCKFIGSCLLAGCGVAILFTVGLMTANNVVNIVAICTAIACVIAAGIVYLVVFVYKPMKKRFYENQKLQKEQATK